MAMKEEMTSEMGVGSIDPLHENSLQRPNRFIVCSLLQAMRPMQEDLWKVAGMSVVEYLYVLEKLTQQLERIANALESIERRT